MYSLSSNEINLIENMVDDAEISYSHLRDDLIDHLCCDIENEINGGISFHDAFELVREKTGLRRLRKIQEDTILLINKRYRIMKNIMKIFGIITLIMLAVGATFKIFHWPGASILLAFGFLLLITVFFPATIWVLRKEAKFKSKTLFTIITYLSFSIFMAGVLFKVQHWPGSGMLLVVGLGSITFLFLPYLLFQNLKSSTNKRQKRIYIVGYISLMIYILGFVFKIMHWPGAAIMLMLGSVSLTTFFLPIYAYNKFKETSFVSAQFIFLSIAIVYFNMFTLLLAMRVSTNILDEFLKTNMALEKQNVALKQVNSINYSILIDSLPENKDLLVECKEKSDSVISFIEDLKLGLIQFADGVNKDEAKFLIDNQHCIENKSDYKMVHFMMLGQNRNGQAYELKDALQAYNLFVRSNFSEVAKKEGLLDLIDTSDLKNEIGEVIPWEEYYFKDQIIVNSISSLTILQRNIQLIENEILHHAEGLILAQSINEKTEVK